MRLRAHAAAKRGTAKQAGVRKGDARQGDPEQQGHLTVMDRGGKQRSKSPEPVIVASAGERRDMPSLGLCFSN